MKYNFNSVTLQIRLLFLTVLLAVAGLALVSQFADTSSYTDDTARVRIVSAQEFNGDAEPPIDNQTPSDALVFSLLLVFANIYVVAFIRAKKITPRLTYLHHIRPRSPPLYSL